MTIRLTYPRTAAGVAAGIIIGLFLSGVAYAVTSNVFRYSTTQTGWLSINAAALGPGVDGLDFNRDYAAGWLVSPSDCYQTGVSLPHGARLTTLTAWHSGVAASQIAFILFRNNNNTGAGEYIVYDYNTDTSNSRAVRSFPLSGPLAAVNNRAFSYGFGVCFNSPGATFRGARLTYTYTTAGD